jgi:hypothetical protein
LSIVMATSSTKTHEAHGRGMGARGMAIVCAIAVGSPAGAALLWFAPVAPFYFGAACAFATAVVGLFSVVDGAVGRAEHGFARLLRSPAFLRLPTLWIGVERFTVGCFVVTFSLYAHRVFGYSDVDTGLLFALFLVPFAAFTWPVAQVRPQAPQLTASLARLVHPLAHGTCVPVHPHTPITQAWPDGQARPQAPQLAASVVVLTQVVPHCVSPRPAGQPQRPKLHT